MLKKTITYEDYDGNVRTEDFYFHLTHAEVAALEMSVDGGLTKMLMKIVNAQDGKRIISTLRDIILRSYGEKSDDGRRFIKSEELRTAFEQTEAYNILFMELALDAKAASDFVNGVIPKAPINVPASASVPNT